MMIALRALLIGLLRFAVVVTLIIFSQKFEVSPLPAWTLGVFVYACLFVATFFFAKWVFAGRLPELRHVITCFLFFTAIETGLEIAFYLNRVRNAGWYDIVANLGFHTLLLNALYFLAIWLAGFQTRRRKIKEHLPEGLEA